MTSLFLAILTLSPVAPQASPDARGYLDKALDLIEQHSIKRQVDFKQMRETAHASARDAKTPAETYPAIRDAIQSLDDHHSQFVEPRRADALTHGEMVIGGFQCAENVIVSVRKGGPAAAVGLKPGMTIFAVGGAKPGGDIKASKLVRDHDRLGKPYDVLAGSSESKAKVYRVSPQKLRIWEDPEGKMLRGRMAWVRVPEMAGTDADAKSYATTLQAVIAKLDRSNPKGWIIDLRMNGGGNMYPMICGLGPLLGEGELGQFVTATEHEKWSYRSGAAYDSDEPVCKVDRPLTIEHRSTPLAILISGITASSGEATLISFLTDPRVRTFGSPTRGLTTGNEVFPLSDGAMLVVCSSQEADRGGKVWEGPIPPDEVVTHDWTRYLTTRDPVLVAACAWIARMSGPSSRAKQNGTD